MHSRSSKGVNHHTFSSSLRYCLRFCLSLLCRKISSSSSLRSVTKTAKKTTASSSFKRFFYFLPILIVVGAYVYSLFSTMSFPIDAKVTSLKPSVSTSDSEWRVYWTQLYEFLKRNLISLTSWLLRFPTQLDQFINSVDLQKYRLFFNQMHSSMPITAGILTVTFSILALLLIVFTIYIFCKLFLFISETPDSLPNQNDALSTTSVHVQRRQSIISDHKWSFFSNSIS